MKKYLTILEPEMLFLANTVCMQLSTVLSNQKINSAAILLCFTIMLLSIF